MHCRRLSPTLFNVGSCVLCLVTYYRPAFRPWIPWVLRWSQARTCHWPPRPATSTADSSAGTIFYTEYIHLSYLWKKKLISSVTFSHYTAIFYTYPLCKYNNQTKYFRGLLWNNDLITKLNTSGVCSGKMTS